MYYIKTLEELEVGDKALIVIDGIPKIVTVEEVDTENGSFTYDEDVWDVSLDKIAVLTDEY